MTDFATYLLQHGVTHEQILAALEEERRRRPPIGRVALLAGILDAAEIFSVLAYQSRAGQLRFGEAAVKLGFLSHKQVEELLREQRRRTPTLEALLIQAGVLTAESGRELRAGYERPSGSMANASIPRPNPSQLRLLAKKRVG